LAGSFEHCVAHCYDVATGGKCGECLGDALRVMGREAAIALSAQNRATRFGERHGRRHVSARGTQRGVRFFILFKNRSNEGAGLDIGKSRLIPF
jgi:hypothetical protein